jgi:hypothetical protein
MKAKWGVLVGWWALPLAGLLGASAQAAVCEARSGPQSPAVVELYTSEGCSSCPPADRWLSSLRPRPEVIALAFHVSYWDRLGWVDRFAQPAFNERQRQLKGPSGASYVYTPQVLVNGQDWRHWPQLPAAPLPAVAEVQLQRDGPVLSARIGRQLAGPAPVRWTGYWAVVEDGHRSDVRAGENAGEKLRHDHVVRQFQPVAPWSADREQRMEWTPPVEPLPPGVSRRTVFVLVDATTQRPLQALALTC